MKVSYNWLRDYLPLTLAPEALAQVFIRIGLEVDGITTCGALLHDIRTAKIESIEKHPNADKLVITSVFDGTTHHQIVTGATNISVGDIVPLSVPGSVIANGMELKAAKLRGVDSFGMLCSESELGIPTESKGIWLLPKDTPLGIDFIAYAQLKDTLFDLAVLPNRSDCMSHFGIARELSAALHLELKSPALFEAFSGDLSRDITIYTPNCLYYSATEIKGLRQGSTPIWMQRRLEGCGIRAINLIVDITNYVLLEFGQPLHAFDLNKLGSSPLSVRNAKESETIVTLDTQTRELVVTDCLIATENSAVAIAGVMGGQSACVDENTTDILLEGAIFDPIATRRTANRLALRTESAVRFEKQVDAEGVQRAIQRATFLYSTLSGGTSPTRPTQFKQSSSPIFLKKSLPYSVDAVNRILGTSHTKSTCDAIFESLGFISEGDSLVIPSWRRHACTTQASLSEEIARIGGFEAIPSTLPTQGIVQENESTQQRQLKEAIQHLIHSGLLETSTFPMISPNDLSKCLLSTENVVQIANPITQEQSVMRPSLLPCLANVAAFNVSRQAESCRYVEFGKTFRYDSKEIVETDCLGVLISGKKLETPFLAHTKTHSNYTFYDAKQFCNSVLKYWNTQAVYVTENIPNYLHPKQAASLLLNGNIIGYIGTLHPSICKAYSLSDQTFYVELFTNFLPKQNSIKTYSAISKAPSTRRDIAFSISKNASFSSIQQAIDLHKHALVKNWFLFDQFESESIGPDKKSMAFGFIYQHTDQTLSDDEVNQAHDAFCKALQDTLPITIR